MLEADGGQSSALIYTRAADLARRLQLDEALSLDRRGRAEEPTQFVIDGEAVILGVDGISDFNALHSGNLNHEVQLYAFDILAMNGDDLRPLPLSMRKASIEKLLHRRPDGIFTGSFEQGEIGPELFRKACEFGLEGWSQSAPIAPLSRRPIERPGQGEEPRAPGDGASENLFARVSVITRRKPLRGRKNGAAKPCETKKPWLFTADPTMAQLCFVPRSAPGRT
jgi:hypothetical protein